MSSTYRGLAVLGGMSVLSVWSLQAYGDKPIPVAQAQQVAQLQIKAVQPALPGGGPEGENEADEPATAISLPLDTRARQRIEAANDFLKEAAWGDAVYVLQKLLNETEDSFIEVEKPGPDGKPVKQWTSVKAEANRLIGSMPPEGLEVYELQFGASSRELLAEARKAPSERREDLQAKLGAEILADVAQRYLHTRSGAEAAELLGTHHLTRGQPVPAALCFDRLLERQKDKAKPMTLLKAALAYQRLGDVAKTNLLWEKLARVSPAGVTIGDHKIPLNQLRAEVDRQPASHAFNSTFEWVMFKGSHSRSAEGHGSTPFLDDVDWQQPTLDQNQNNDVRKWVDAAVKRAETSAQKEAVMPAFFPVAVTTQTSRGEKKLVIYRTYRSVQAVDVKTGLLEWESVLKWSIENLIKTNQSANSQLQQWQQFYQNSGAQSVLYENSTVGTLSADSQCVYAVDDLALPPHPTWMQQRFGFNGQPNLGALTEIVNHNKLMAVELSSGKLRWELGGPGEGELNDCYFLGPPMPLGGKLYLLVEKSAQLKLFCLDPPTTALAGPKVNWSQPLASLQNPLPRDVARRMHAATLAYGDGVLVCPTNAGAILGVDLLTHSLVWVYHYDRPQSVENEPRMIRNRFGVVAQQLISDWKCSAPIIQGGKVVFTAPDGGSVHCVSLRDGTQVWKKERADDLYLGGVHDGKVLLVGRSSCRALDLDTGKSKWVRETGLPSGQGVASDNIYYLPLRSPASGAEPEICAIDIKSGEILKRTRSRRPTIPNKDDRPVVPGNLIFFEGKVISQNHEEVRAFKQLRVKLEEMNALIAKNPNDPVGLTERAELRRNDGKIAGAIEDLRLALKNNPKDATLLKARGLLYESLTEAFQRDFEKNEANLEEYRALCKIDVPSTATVEQRRDMLEEQQRRQANFLCLLAKGREKQGRLADAFRHYVEFGALGDKAGLLTVIDEPTVRARPDIWAQGRIGAMMAKASPEQRKPLDEEISRQWRDLKGASSDLNKLRNFVIMFGESTDAGSEARLQLAQRIIDSNATPHAFLEAELQLMQVRRNPNKVYAARAVELLAGLMTKKNQLDDAAYWINILAREYPNVKVRGDKTGLDYLNDLATDKRFLPYLDESDQYWKGTEIKAREISGHFPNTQRELYFSPRGENIPFYQRHALTFNRNLHQIKVEDRITGAERWSRNLSRQNNTNLTYLWNQNNFQSQEFRYDYAVQGHLAVFQVGLRVYGLDMADNEVLWEHSILDDDTMRVQQMVPNPQGGMNVVFADGRLERVAQDLPVQPGFVCVQSQEGLLVLDPIRGTPLWTKSDVNSWTHIFGDTETLYLVEVRRDGSVSNSRAVRARDGVNVDVPDFADLYQKRLAVVGHNLLVRDTDAKGGVQLRLYDVHSGKDLWKKSFAADAVVMTSEDPSLVGIVEPKQQGKVTVFDMAKQADPVLEAKILPKDIDKAESLHLLRDNDYYYVAVNGPPDNQVNRWGGPWINLINGMRGIKVNGWVYAFDPKSKRDDKVHWKNEVPNQVIILEQFENVPIVLFVSRAQRRINAGVQLVTENLCYSKRTGKLRYKSEVQNNNVQYHSLDINPRAGTIDLITYNKKIQFYLDK